MAYPKLHHRLLKKSPFMFGKGVRGKAQDRRGTVKKKCYGCVSYVSFPTQGLSYGSLPALGLSYGSLPTRGLSYGSLSTLGLFYGSLPIQGLSYGSFPSPELSYSSLPTQGLSYGLQGLPSSSWPRQGLSDCQLKAFRTVLHQHKDYRTIDSQYWIRNIGHY
ncbi:hypothetical protein Trydic_g10616 [Trypoxylus dichotomus]